MGDPIKIDSVWHVITLRSDLREYILYDTRIILQDLILDAEQISHNCLYDQQCRPQAPSSPTGSYPMPQTPPTRRAVQ